MAEQESNVSEQLSRCTRGFALDIFKEIRKQESQNVALSPMSLGMALSMVYGGAKNVTRQELKQVLHLGHFKDESTIHVACLELLESLSKKTETGLDINVANRLYLKKGTTLVDDYRKLLQSHYHTDMEVVVFDEQVRQLINAWVESKTNDKIKNLIPEKALDQYTRMVLVNAIYFKGDWASAFDASRTSPEDFYLNTDTKVTVSMMHKTSNFYFAEDNDLQCKVVGLPYVHEHMIMHVILPDERDGLVALEDKLTADTLRELTNTLCKQKVMVAMPKFKMEWGGPLKTVLSAMGLSSLFSDRYADLSGMSTGEDLCVDSVVHKCFVEVNEQGTEAAAATGVLIRVKKCAIIEKIIEFVVDHPFLFTIEDKHSGTILFMGRVTNPAL